MRSFGLEQKESIHNDPFEEFLAAAAYAVQSGNQTKLSLAQLVFGRDMFIPLNFQLDWQRIKANKQNRIQKKDDRKNLKRNSITIL